MSDPAAAGPSPNIQPTSSLAPPANPPRPSSSNSNRSSNSRGGRSNNSSASRSNSRHSSRDASDASAGRGKAKRSGSTTTISGGTIIGRQKNDAKAVNKGRGKGEIAKPDELNGRRTSVKKPSPIQVAPQRANSDPRAKSPDITSAPRSLHTAGSARDALEIAREKAGPPQSAPPQSAKSDPGSEALSNLQKMISDLKSISPGAAPAPGLAPGSRSSSGAKEPSPPPKKPATLSSQKLKADAPSFTPSFHPSVSPVASQPSISPGTTQIPLHSGPPKPVASSTQNRRSSGGSISSYASLPSLGTSGLPVFPNAIPYPLQFQNQLAVHAEADNEDVSPYEGQYQQQQLLAAQQIQFQQIQLLQAQLSANQLAQQQAQQQQMGSFIAPRFQALAAQRAAAQQQQQAQQLAQAQQLYEMQQQQLQQYQHSHEVQRAVAQATLVNPPAVFEEDSPETRPASLGPTGRPQLAPSFTFGVKKEEPDRSSASPPQQPPVINRSEGIGGAAATGLAGLAARAHRRTGSELTTSMQQSLDIQSQIEALQAKQKALLAEDMAARETNLPQLSDLAQKTPSQTLSRHRRVQSTMPSATDLGSTDFSVLQDLPRPVIRGEMPPPPVPSAHSRRHSVNVFNKPAGSGAGFSMSSLGGDIPEDLISNGGGHHRSNSRSGFESGNWRLTTQANAGVTDLAAAQAQLQSLAQFRAAAGGGHSKMASFSFPNMLPNILAATTLQAPAGQSLFQQQQAFQMQLQQSAQGPQRKSLFAPYLPQVSLPPLLQAGKLVVGILRVNKKNRSDAYVATDVLEADIYICGSKDRNRALEGDIVAIELLDVNEVWGTKKDKEEKKRKKEENAAYDLKPATVKKLEKKKDDVEVEGQGLTLFDDEEVNDETKPLYAGHVVAVVERMPGQLFSGQLGVLRPSSAATKEKQELERRDREGDRAKPSHEPESRPKIVWFKPTDKRVPLIAIPTEQAPTDFIDNPDAYSDRLFVATIKRWPITSLHPFGTLVEELGPIGDCEVETSALLKDCNFPTEEFSEQTLKCLPPMPWSIPDREYEVRTDLRAQRVFTIDPTSAKDLDDALSITKNEDGTYVVGVHIADVSYFVKSNTALDRDARKRATSVYLVQRAVPMLPPQLSEELCSLVPGVERLTFSATFVLGPEGEVVSQSFARTIIKSCGKLSYDDAQGVISGSTLKEGKVSAGIAKDVESDIRSLFDLASKMRTKRIENGAMAASKTKVTFALNDKGQPVDCGAAIRMDSNSLVEEYMLLANTYVGRMIANGLPEQSLLRRHEAPIERRVEAFVNRAAKLGYEFDATDARSLQKGFDKVQDKEVALCLELLKRKSMQRARYFCTGMLDIAKYGHWALNTPLYTHFTSPIRRYADVLVHRMLDAILMSPNPTDVKFHMDRDQVAKCAQQCNMKKASAKLAEDQSTHLFLCMLVHDLTERYGPVVRQGRVTGVLDAAFDVVVPEFGIEKRVHVDKMPVDNVVFDEHRDILSLYWTSQDVLSYLAETIEDPHLLKIKALGEKHAAGTFVQTSDAGALFNEDMDSAATSTQYQKSASRSKPEYKGLRKTAGGHRIQDVKELMEIPVIITSDMTKSPPVLVVYACNPYAS